MEIFDETLAALNKLDTSEPEGDLNDEGEVIPSQGKAMQDMLTGFADTIKTQIVAPMQALASEVAEIKQGRKDESVAAEKTNLDNALAVAVQKHPDFETYKNDMGQIWEKHPGMTVEDIFLLAKARRIGVEPQVTETERSGSLLARPVTERPEEVRLGSRGFTDMCNDALTKRGR